MMTAGFTSVMRGALLGVLGAAALIGGTPAAAQVQAVDPDKAIDADLTKPAATPAPAPAPAT